MSSERELVAQAHPARHQRPAFGAVWGHLAIKRALKIGVQSLPSRADLCVLFRRQGCTPLPKRLKGLRTVVFLRPVCGFLHLNLLQDGLVEDPLGFRSVLCAPLCMFNGPQDTIQAVASLTQSRPLPRKRDRQRFCATANWGVQQRGDLAQRKPYVPQHENPLRAAEILVAVESIASLRTMRRRQQLEPVVVMQCPYSNAAKLCELLDAECAHGSHLWTSSSMT